MPDGACGCPWTSRRPLRLQPPNHICRLARALGRKEAAAAPSSCTQSPADREHPKGTQCAKHGAMRHVIKYGPCGKYMSIMHSDHGCFMIWFRFARHLMIVSVSQFVLR